jgi:hypothetical protein
MQNASAAFQAAAAARRAWMPARVRADWGADGYSGDGSIDDLTGQTGEEINVSHDLDDGYPATVRFVSGTAAPVADTTLGGRTVGGAPMSAAAYWSPLRIDSPMYGYERDVAPLTIEAGLVTLNGPEYATIFTGQTVGTPVKSGKATLQGLSASRVALMKPVQPPAVSHRLARSTRSSWPVSWCLYACGLYAGPKIREGVTAAYFPMHGGLWRFHDGRSPGGNQIAGLYEQWILVEVDATGATTFATEIDWIPGPYVAAPAVQLTAALSRRIYETNIPLGTTAGTEADALSQAGAAARVEAWIKGDAADVNNAPGGSGSVSRLFGFQFDGNNASFPSAAFGVGTDRKVYVTVFDGVNTRTLQSSATLPTDGAWYFIGAAYDFVADRLWVNLNGTVQSSSPGTMLQANLPATDTWLNIAPYMLSYLPVSDITLTTGAQANADNYPLWRNDASFAPTARVGLSAADLIGVGHTSPREAWQVIADYAQVELAMLRCDELDVVEYLPPGWWVRSAQQVLRDEFHTTRNAGPFDVDFDPTRIRTSVKVNYSRAQIPAYSADYGVDRRVLELNNAASSNSEVYIPQGVTDLRFPFSTPVIKLYTSIQLATGAQADSNSHFASSSYVSLNAMPDGTGTEYTTGVTVTVVAWDPGGVTVRFSNSTTTPLFLANSVNAPPMCLTGTPMALTSDYVQVGDSGGARGERLLEASASGALSEPQARRLARNLLANLRHPMATVGDESSGVEVTANPLRQPGDLVTLTDPETGVGGGLWRLQSVRHKLKGASYTQEVTSRQVYPICVVGQGRVGYSLVGPPT